MMRKANKRKESDMDFEEKKMNLSLGQDELEREAGYYVRPASPEPPVERWPPVREVVSRRPPVPRLTPERYVEDPEYYPPAAPPEYYGCVHILFALHLEFFCLWFFDFSSALSCRFDYFLF